MSIEELWRSFRPAHSRAVVVTNRAPPRNMGDGATRETEEPAREAGDSIKPGVKRQRNPRTQSNKKYEPAKRATAETNYAFWICKHCRPLRGLGNILLLVVLGFR